jgi:hypothetical protein
MLLANQQVDEIPFDHNAFDQTLWDSHVALRIECNLYRKRFAPLQMIDVPSTSAAVVARALARVARKPSLVWVALSLNCANLLDCLD